jgi:lysine 2,3-aminomutase
MGHSLYAKRHGQEPAPAGAATESTNPSDPLPFTGLPDYGGSPCQGEEIPDWQDWQWQLRSRIRTIPRLIELFPALDTAGIPAAAAKFPFAITPYYASLIRRPDASDPIFRMSVPQAAELFDFPYLHDDPLEEEQDSPVPGLIHRYPDRALLVVTSTCAMYCRHCTRKRVAGQRESCISNSRLERAVRYLRSHPEIRSVIISGGDPLTMSTPALESVIATLRTVPSIDVIRIGTRAPVTMPMRVTESLATMLKNYHPIYLNTHFNHPVEITAESAAACRMLADAGVVLGNQSVLLRGVNDDPLVMEELCRGLLRIRVRPYYLFQCDLVRGVEHFRTPISRGIEIMEYLRGRLDGLGIPTYVIDSPHGGGKLPVLPSYIVSSSPTHTVLRNFEGMLVAYPEPVSGEQTLSSRSDVPSSSTGVWELASGRNSRIMPRDNARMTRRHQRGERTGGDPKTAAAASATGTGPVTERRRPRSGKLTIGMVYDLRTDYLREGFSAEQVAEFDTEETITALADGLRELGYEPDLIGHARALAQRLVAGDRWDLVFNIAEGVSGRSREAQVPSLLEMYGIPCTFSDPLVCALTLDKAMTKRMIASVGLPTPRFRIVSNETELAGVDLTYPLFAKPNAEGTGKGVDAMSRIENPKQLRQVCRRLLAKYSQPVLVEEYLPGREFTVGILGTGPEARVIGSLEVSIRADAPSRDYGYVVKEKCEKYVEYLPVARDGLRADVEQLALASYRVCECRDVGRVDIRLDSAGKPSFIEINPLPGMHPTHSDLPMIATAEGIAYRDLLDGIVRSAIRRVVHA